MRYWEIAQTLRDEIVGGRHALGSRLPTEEQLMQAYGASRHAVREALRLLTEDGLISRRPRAGSTVVALSPQLHFVQRVASVQELINYPATTERREIASGYVMADHELAAVLRCAPGAAWFCFETVRCATGSRVPLCHTHVYVRPEYAGIARHRQHGQLPFADQIADLYGVQADSTILEVTAAEVPKASAAVLKVPAGSPALTTIRRYVDEEGRQFEVSIAVHPAPRYAFTIQLRRERAVAAKRGT
jgi:DNA-binding GntR family transcriptional regulator